MKKINLYINMSWNEGYTLTLYCSACNDPPGTRDIAYTKGSIKKATAGYTVAFNRAFYDKNIGERIHLDIFDEDGKIIASHQPYILDFHGKGDEIIDFYIGERDECNCHKHIWSGKECRFKFI